MSSQKRRLSNDSTDNRSTKKVATTSVVTDEDEDDLQSILAQIKAHEQSEALARKLQEEWNAPSPPTSQAHANRTHSIADDAIAISDDAFEPEDDESMARRLAKQWEDEDVIDLEPPQLTKPTKPTLSFRKGKGRSQSDSRLLPVSKLQSFRGVFTDEKTCACGARLPSPRGHVVFSAQSPPPTLLRLLHMPCKSCKTNHCRGCMTSVSCPISCKGKDEDANCPVETCCTNVRIIAIYEALCAFDKQYLGERETSDQRAREAAAKAQKRQVGSVGPGGTGYGTGATYATARRVRSIRGRGTAAAPAESSRLDPLVHHFDEIIVRALQTIMVYLPAPYCDNPQIYDLLPHPSIDALLFLSQIPNLLGDLLRNDSIMDWIIRIEVYHATLGLLRRMADCELTLEVLIGPRWEMTKSCGLEDWMWDEDSIVWDHDKDTDEPVRAPPLYVHFKKLTKQCEAFLASASSMLEIGGDEDAGEDGETAVKATSLCGDIIAARDDIERAMSIMGKDTETILHGHDPMTDSTSSNSPGECKDKGKGKDPVVDIERTYARECERLAFKYTTLSQRSPTNATGLHYPGYNYAHDVAQTANATRNPRNRLHLVKELAVMATSLPPGVWVRVDEVRNDVIKVMIAGPEGTPYAGGLFEFDSFIPLEYPHKPPLMHLRTTGGGSVRFNPNLYNNGKVCLSLLGTWAGRPEEQWSPKSTLLQVLVSIQSMILIELPYFNEPGYGKAVATDQRSIKYNKNICLQTTRLAIVDWLNDEHKDGIWGEVIASHFLTRHAVIKKCIQDWAKTQPSIRKYNRHSVHANDISGALMPMFAAGAGPPPPSPAQCSKDASDMEEFDMCMTDVGMMTYPVPFTPAVGPPDGTGKGQKREPHLSTMDLLEEYDRGIERVRKWKVGGVENERE